MIGKRNVLEDHAVVVFVERGPAAVLALHRQNPVQRALHRLVVIALVAGLHPAQRQQHLRAVVHVGIELVVELEVPARGSGLGILHAPVALARDLLLQHPLAGLHQARIVGGNAALRQRKHRVRRVPHRRHARLHAEGRLFLDAQLLELVHGANDLRIVQRISQAAQRDDGVHDAGIDRAQAVAHLQPLQHPLLRHLQRAANAADGHAPARRNAPCGRAPGRNCASRSASSPSAAAAGSSSGRRRTARQSPARRESS